MGLPDLTTEEGRAVAQDMLMEAGWPRLEIDSESLWQSCSKEMLHELACRFLERMSEYWAGAPEDAEDHPVRAIEAKRKWLRGEISAKELTRVDRRMQERAARQDIASSAWALSWAAAWTADKSAQLAANHTARDAARAGAGAGGRDINDEESPKWRAERDAQLALTVEHLLQIGGEASEST